MRHMRCTSAEAVRVAAAHSRQIQPGDVVDFDEAVNPGQGGNYTLETALGADVDKFEAVPEPEPETPLVDPETDFSNATIEPISIVDVNTDAAKALVAEAGTLEQIDALERAERDNPKHVDGRVGVMRAIEERREALKGEQ